MSSLPASMKKIRSKIEALECSQHYTSIFQTRKDFSRCSRAANSAVLDPIWPNFKLVRAVMDDLVTCKYEEDLIIMKALECS